MTEQWYIYKPINIIVNFIIPKLGRERILILIYFFFYSIIKSAPELTVAQLLVNSADQSDAGNYACSSEAGYSNVTAIHVITGKNLVI